MLYIPRHLLYLVSIYYNSLKRFRMCDESIDCFSRWEVLIVRWKKLESLQHGREKQK
uniref:Uncharacterized protein n=1 Tax=Arion vulgaris TaxID=1028688 RepID=A0A0B7B9J1_9EUPU